NPSAPRLPDLELGNWSSYPQIQSALEINVLFIVGGVLAFFLAWALKNTRWGLVLRTVGDSSEAANALGYKVNRVRVLGTVAGGFLSGVGGSYLSLYYPGTWNEGLSSGQGLMAVALVIFARWDPVRCFYVSLLFGGATALGPALQTIGITANYYLYGAAPYFLTLGLLIHSSSVKHALAGAPGEVSISR
ncbi:MAG: ABC transporter permease, partial [Litoreibacter sp.]|nr:ABC transporter permease [Litoreibacter sp.]